MHKKLFPLVVLAVLTLASLACTVTINTGSRSPDMPPVTLEAAKGLLLISALYVTGGVGALSTMAKGQNLENGQVYQLITIGLIFSGVCLVLFGLRNFWVGTVGVGLVFLSCLWGLYGDRLFR